MRQFGRFGTAPSRTYGKTAAGFYDRSRNLWAEVEADEEARRRKEEEEKKLDIEEEERWKRRKERKAKRKQAEEQERGGLELEEERADEDEDRLVAQVGGFVVSDKSCNELGGGEIVAESAGIHKFTADSSPSGVPQPAIVAGAETPPTSPERDPDKSEVANEWKSAPPSSLLPPRTPTKPQPLEVAALISTNHLPPLDPATAAPVVDSASNPLPLLQGDGSNGVPAGIDADSDEASSSVLTFYSASPILSPDRRGGLRRRSSRLTTSPGFPMAASPSAIVPRLRLSSSGEGGCEEPGVSIPMQKMRLSSVSMVSVAVTPAKTKTEVDRGEYEVFYDEDEECEGGQQAVKLGEEHDGTEHEQVGQDVEGECFEWRNSSIIQEELDSLLNLCTVNSVLDFTVHITSQLQCSTLSKLGEASYSEVFLQTPTSEQNPLHSRTVLKIIPFGHPAQCPVSQIHDELLITVEMSPLPGFIGFQSAHIVRGPYPAKLLDLWDYWDQQVKAGGSENDRPDFYSEQQLFVIIGLEDGGIDLEKWSFKGDKGSGGGWGEAREVFWRVAGSLARGEREREFEHRDLHFGNIVIKRVPIENRSVLAAEGMMRQLTINDNGKHKTGMAKRQSQYECETSKMRTKLQVSLIDYTLSRARCGNEQLRFSPLDDEALFQGRGDYQFDIYRL